MNKIFPRFTGGRIAFGLLILRLVFGAAMIMHSLPKLSNPMHWMDAMSNAAPPFIQLLGVAFELGGGVALILGLFTPLVTAMGIIFFFTAYWTQKRGLPWVGGPNSWELPSLYFALMIALLCTGPGKHSLDFLIFGKKHNTL